MMIDVYSSPARGVPLCALHACMHMVAPHMRACPPACVPARRSRDLTWPRMSQEAIDTDDGSAYYNSTFNFFVYAANGLKSDFNGNNNRANYNVYGYVSNCWGPAGQTWLTGIYNQFVGNDCIANSDTGGFSSDCNKFSSLVVKVHARRRRHGPHARLPARPRTQTRTHARHAGRPRALTCRPASLARSCRTTACTIARAS